MTLNNENYYTTEANQRYMSVSIYKDFAGTWGHHGCEFAAMKKLNGEWEEPRSTAMMVGSYVDAYVEGTLDEFKMKNPDIYKRDGELKSEYVKANHIIQRMESDRFFMTYLSGEKQTIMVGKLFGTEWKIKMDSYIPDVAIVDLKVMRSISEVHWVKDYGYIDTLRYWNYDIQGAVYQEIVYQNTGKRLPFYIAATTKENEPDLRIVQITQNYLDEALSMVESRLPRILRVRSGEEEPDRCETCDCCRHFRVLSKPISLDDLTSQIAV